MVKYSYYGHACFLLDDGKHKVLTDPFLMNNPQASISSSDVDCDFILLTHGHSDHLGDAAEIAKRTGAIIVGIPEVLAACDERQTGLNSHGMNLGGSYVFPFGKLRMTIAHHSSGVPGGVACGYVIYIGDKVIYFSGDTALFSDMQIIGKKDPLDYALLPIGDNYTMGMEDAALAAQWLNARVVIPLHYDTWPVIEQDVMRYKELTESMTASEVIVVSPGETVELV